MLGLGYGELLVVLVLGLLLFGSHLPRMARTFGRTVSSIRQEARSLKEDVLH
jgi:Sec-independent protein translocase protein TatA